MEPFQRLIIPYDVYETNLNLEYNSDMFDLSEVKDYDKFYQKFIRNLNNTEIIRAIGNPNISSLFDYQYIKKTPTYIPKKGTAAEIVCQALCDDYNSQIIGMKGLFQKKKQLPEAYKEAYEILKQMQFDPNYRVTYEKEERIKYGKTIYFKFIYEPQTAENRAWLTQKLPYQLLFHKLEDIDYVETDLNFVLDYGKQNWVYGGTDQEKEKQIKQLFKHIDDHRKFYQEKGIPYIELGDKKSPFVKRVFSDKDPVLFKNYNEIKEFEKLSERKQDAFVEERIENTREFFNELDHLGIDLF